MKTHYACARTNFIKIITLTSFLLAFHKNVLAQPSTATTVDYVKLVGFKSTDPIYFGNFRLKFDNGASSVCVPLNGGSGVFYPQNSLLRNYVSSSVTSPFTMNFEGWIEHSSYECTRWSGCGMGDCDFNSGCGCEDEYHCDKSGLTFNLNDFEPGLDNTVVLNYCSNQISYGFRYKPTAAMVSGVTFGGPNGGDLPYDGGYVCANEKVRLAVTTAIAPQFSGALEYVWEYNVAGDETTTWVPNPGYCGNDPICADSGTPVQQSAQNPNIPAHTVPCCFVPPGEHVTTTNWHPITTTSGSVDNGALQLVLTSIPALAQLTTQTTVTIRVLTRAHGIVAESHGSKALLVSPHAPKFNLIETFESCPNTPTGSVRVTGITGAGKYQYTLRPGHNSNKPCSPIANCLNGITSGDFTGASITMPNVPYNYDYTENGTDTNAEGKYTLWVSNFGGSYGLCSATENITISPIPALGLALAEPLKDASCHGYTDGEVKLSATGGKAPFVFSFGGTTTNQTGIFSSLGAGNYTATVIDACQQVNATSSLQISIAAPKSVTATIGTSALTCNSPSDGAITSTVSDGPGTYNYSIRNASGVVQKLENTSVASWNATALSAGSYTVVIHDALRPTCPAFSAPIVLAPPPTLALTTANVLADPVSCHDGNDGKVTLSGLDMSGKYTYTLTRATDRAVFTTTTDPRFSNLSGAAYTLAMTRNVPGCNDLFTLPQPVTLSQPAAIAIAITSRDISCFGVTDGSASAAVTGGTGPAFSYTWEQRIGATWSTLGSTTNSLSRQANGTFRVTVKDAHNCTAVSSPVSIAEPPQLTVGNATVTDIRCLGDKGFISLTAQGGTGALTYHYAKDPSSTFTAFTSTTPLDAGTYSLKALDANRCAVSYPQKMVITQPTSPVDFTATLSDYNGVNISCFNGANGTIALTPSGGNGGNFQGYVFSRDNLPYQSASLLGGINAGQHVISVKDGRGCIKSRPFTFTQSIAMLALHLDDKQDVVCVGDLTGGLLVSGSGGIAPFEYSLDGGSPQSTGRFTNLGAGTYSVVLADKNQCANTFQVEVKSVNTPMEISAAVDNVKCFDGSDGKISISVAQGMSPYAYRWASSDDSGPVRSGLSAGAYTLTVTDKVGCAMEQTIDVDQPIAPLQMVVAAVPVCFGSDNGSISVNASGGTAPFFYSADGGATFTSDSNFPALPAGNYTVRVKDGHNCSLAQQAEIGTRNLRPEADFIVSSRESALDTLVISEISVPKPDSIHWQFDQRAQVLDNDAWLPKIRFDQVGDYNIEMTGYFGGCVYTVSRVLSINAYDPASLKTKEPAYEAIQSLSVAPNPSTAQFTVVLRLNYKHKVSIVVYDVLGTTHYKQSFDATDNLSQAIDLSAAAAGIYLVRVVTPKGSRDVRLSIAK